MTPQPPAPGSDDAEDAPSDAAARSEVLKAGEAAVKEVLAGLRARQAGGESFSVSGTEATGARAAFAKLPREQVNFEEEERVHKLRRWKNRKPAVRTNRPQTFDDQMKASTLKERRDHIKLRSRLGNSILGLMAFQLVVADVGFFLYGFGNDWKIPTAAITAWLAALVIEIIAVVRIVARFLFPSSGLPGDDPPKP